MPVLAEETEVVPRLQQLGVTRAALLDVVRAAVGARRNATLFHPLNAGGQYAYLEGTAHLRRVFVSGGWKICRRDNIESVFNPETGIKIVYQNAERAGDLIFDPLATSKKGAGAARAVEQGQYDLFPETRKEEIEESNATTWCLFVMANGDDVRAEFSCPVAINEDQYDEFHERIVLVKKGEWQGLDLSDDSEPPIDFDISVSRKS